MPFDFGTSDSSCRRHGTAVRDWFGIYVLEADQEYFLVCVLAVRFGFRTDDIDWPVWKERRIIM